MPAPYIVADPYLPDARYDDEPLSTCYTSAFNSPLSTSNDYYDVVDKNCSLAPYVDKIYWKIDGASIYTFPNNVKWERD